jgi:hypothetical protein
MMDRAFPSSLNSVNPARSKLFSFPFSFRLSVSA